MGLDDLMSTESALVAAATAAIFSPRVRETMRRGAVIGVAGVLRAGDVASGAARGVARGVRGNQPPAGANGAGAPQPPAATRRTSGRAAASTSSRPRSTRRKPTSGS